MYKRIITAVLTTIFVCGVQTAFAEETAMRVNIPENSYVMDINFTDTDETVNSSRVFTSDRDVDLVIVSDNAIVQIVNNNGEIVAEKEADKAYTVVSVTSGEEYSIKVIATQDNSRSSVFVYGK